jgi:glycosyltransferase involved in cell wall biosynthesis
VVRSFARADLPRLLKGHHIKLFPPLVEGFGLSLLEAMACGLAPVTTSVGGPATLVREGDNGLVVAPGTTDAIVLAIERLLDDRALLHRLQNAARSSAKRYGLTRVADETLAIYQDALVHRG